MKMSYSFSDRGPFCVTLEDTPQYFTTNDAIEVVKEFNPQSAFSVQENKWIVSLKTRIEAEKAIHARQVSFLYKGEECTIFINACKPDDIARVVKESEREDDKLGYQGSGQATTMPNPKEKVEFRPGISPRQHNPAIQQHSFGSEQPPMDPRGMNKSPQKNDNPVQQFQPSAQHGFRPPMSSFFPPETGLPWGQNPHYLPNQHLQLYCSAAGRPPFPSYGHAPYYSPQYPGYPLNYPASPYQQGGSYYQPYYQASGLDQSQNPNDKSVRHSESRSPSQSAARSKHQDNVDEDVEMKNESVLKELPEVQQQRQQGSSVTGKDDEQKQHKEEKEEQIMTAASRKLKVSHIPKGVSHDVLQLFFENEKKSGGGEVKGLDFDTNSSTAIIEFEDPSVIDRMLQRLPLAMQKKQLKIEVYKEVDESEKVVVDEDENNAIPKTTVEVRGFSKDISKDTLEMYFENRKRSGGGPISNIEWKDEVALITFESEAATNAVLQRNQKLNGMDLDVKLCVPPKPVPMYLDKVLITGLNEKITEDCLINFLEARGGVSPTEILYAEDDEQKALVTFESPPDLQKLKDACQKKKLEGATLVVSQVPVSRCVLVTNLAPKTSEDMVHLYFENTRRSGGGPVEKVEMNKEAGACLIYFEDFHVLDLVLGREHTLDNTEIKLQLFHPCISRTTSVDDRGKVQKPGSFVTTYAVSKRNQKLNGMDLDVKLYVPPKPVPMYLDKVLITGLNEKIAEDCLTNFLEAKGGVSLTEILYAEDDEQKALVTFESPPDLQKLQDACQKKKLEGATLVVSQVPISRCVLVTNLAPKTSEETVYLYFENTRCSGGGPVEKVEMNKEAGACLIYFEDLHVLDLVLGRKHTLDNSEIQLQLFHPCIGRTTSVDNRGKFQNPESFICKVNIHIIAFLKQVPNAKVRLEQEMSKVHGRLEVSSDNMNMKVFPMLTAEMEGVKRLVKIWKETAEQKLEECMKQFDCMEHQIMSDLWVSTLADLEKIQIPNEKDVIVCTDQQHSIIRVVGFKDMVSYVSNNLKQIIHNGEKELELKKLRTSDKKILSKREIYFLLAVNFPDKVHMKCREVKCTIQQKDDIIIFEGILLDIKQAQILMYETIQTITKSSMPDYSKRKLELLALKETCDYLKQKLKEKGCMGIWEIDGNSVIVYDISDQKANEGIQIIKKCLVKNAINMTPEQRLVISSDAWKAVLTDINRQHQGHTIIHVQNSTIEITATDQYAGKITDIVQDFISANALYKQTVTVNPRKIRYLEQWKKPQIDEICKSQQKNMVTIDLSQGVITLQGTQKGLCEAESRMSDLLKQMCCKQTSLEKPGICKYLCSNDGKELIKHIEYVNKCTIDLTNPEDDPTSSSESQLELQKHLQHPVKYHKCRMFGGRTLSVFHGDITDLDIHILISPCNKTLDHSGGLAKRVVEKGGAVILGECSQFRHQKFMNGDVICTRGGNLKCKIVAHGVSPLWQGGKDNEEEYLKKVVFKSLEEADKKKLTSIGIPAIGTGKFGWPVSVATLVITRTVHGYFQEHSNSVIKNVCLCDLDVQHVKSFLDAVKKVFPNDDLTFHEDPSQTAAKGSSSLGRSSGRQTYSDEVSTTPNNPQSSEYIHVPQLKIIFGDISTCSVDAIVNPTDAVVCLDGCVSTAILKKAGAELKKMCSTLGNEMKKKGIVVTPGFKLSCGYIIHVNVRDQQDGWKGIILKCLKEAVKRKLWSIAFPVLGTGNVGSNPEQIGKALFEATCEIIQAGSSNLQEIQMVVFESQMVSKIEEGIKSAQESVPKASTLWQTFKGYLGFGEGKSASKPHVIRADGMKSFVYVCADSESVIQDAVYSLETKFNKELDTDAITDELIKQLSEDKVSEIEEIGRKFNVMIKVEKRVGRVRIEGLLADVGKVKNEVLNLMRSIEKMENKKQKAEMLSQLVQWYHIEITKEGQDLVEYAKDINATIEEAYQRKEQILKLHADSGFVIIDFDALEEYSVADPDNKVKVLRKGKIKDSVSEMPLQWDPMDKDNLKVIAVQPASQEYADVASHFMATVKKENKDASISIAKIERIQNKTLYAQYQSKKKLIDEMNPGQINEMDLWHGTAEQAVDSINLHGFNRSFCGKNATLYGDGVYFARDACYSVRDLYSPLDAAGNKRMYLTKVLTGKYAKGDKGMRVPPPLVSGRPELHDCVVDDVDNPCIFIIFHDTQAYPEYLIIFKWN